MSGDERQVTVSPTLDTTARGRYRAHYLEGMSMRVVLLGAPGSGKGTHGRRIAERYGIPYLSTGELLRRHISDGTELGKAVQPYVYRGDLVPDELILSGVLSELQEQRTRAGYILDGFPRTLSQAMAADQAMNTDGIADAVVFLDVPQDELLYRIHERARQSGRTDDQSDAVISRRMAEFAAKTLPVRDYYERRGFLRPVDAVGSVDEVTGRILAALDELSTA